MIASLKNLRNDEALLEKLSDVYMRSYNTLSAKYKSPAEMALYTQPFFYHKLKRFAKEGESDSLSRSFVVTLDDQPAGFARYSRIPDYYKENINGETKDLETGTLDGYEYAWYRKVKFVNNNVKLDDSTVILNQIYLDPAMQRKSLGTYVLSQTLPHLHKAGVKNVILEYNAENKDAEKFYRAFGFEPLADTEDLDHILNDNGRPQYRISKVKMVHVPVEKAMQLVNRKLQQKKQARDAAIGNVLVALVQNAQASRK